MIFWKLHHPFNSIAIAKRYTPFQNFAGAFPNEHQTTAFLFCKAAKRLAVFSPLLVTNHCSVVTI